MTETALQAWAGLAWRQFDDNEKAGVRFGLFPARLLDAAKLYQWTPRDIAVALMDEAKRDGGMIA